MYPLLLALVSAGCIATVDALTKRYTSHLTVSEMAAARLFFGIPFFVVLLFFAPAPHLERSFFLIVLCLVPLETTAFFLYMRAIQVSPLSLTVPFLAFTPVFLVLTGWMILGEQLNTQGIVGIAFVAFGSYVLNLTEARHGMLGPFRAIGREKGSVLMLAVSLLYAFTSALGKKAILQSNALFFGCFYYLLLGTIICGGLFATRRVGWRSLKRVARPGLCIGVLMVFSVLAHMTAISLMAAAYMIAIKRTSILFSIVYATLLFKEENIRERFWGALLMVTGVFIIALAG